MKKLISLILVLGILGGAAIWIVNTQSQAPERNEVRIELPDTFEK